jgi:HlyD family secretion protein
MKNHKGRIVLVAVALAIAAVIIAALRPSPVRVEAVPVVEGPMRVTVDEEGEARAHDRFVLSSPVAGRLERVELHEGDPIAKGQPVATVEPSPLDPMQREEVLARVGSAEASRREADEQVRRARADYEQCRRERARAEQLVEDGLISVQTLEQAKTAEVTSKSEIEAAVFRAQAAAAEVEVARAGLLALDSARHDAERLVTLRSPVKGRVLRVVEKSERVLSAGSPIVVLGDAHRLEVVVDVLSTDAVNIQPGATMLLEGWGGDVALRARVRTVEPSAFTKVSALGVEEQRVNIVADFVDSPGPLGDGYRVETKTIIWETDTAVKVPLSALFRSGERWCVFVAASGRTERRTVEIGHMNQTEAEVLGGISVGEFVIPHPPSELEDGERIQLSP